MRYLLGAIMTLVLTLCFAWVFGHIPFSDNAAHTLEKSAGFLGIYGIENVEDFYMFATLAVSFIAALLIAWRLTRLIQRLL